MVSVDIYVNETTRHADVVLPSPDPLARSHYDLALYQFAARNVANYSPALFERDQGLIAEEEIFLRLTGIVTGQGPDADAGRDRRRGRRRALIAPRDRHRGLAVEGRDPAEITAALEPRRGPERILDLLLRTGAYGDGFGRRPDGLTLERARGRARTASTSGPHEPRLPEVLRTPSGKIELAPEPITADVRGCGRGSTREPGTAPGPEMVLIGRRQLRSNNSWMHNLNALVKGKDRCTALVNPLDAERLGLEDGGRVRLRSAAGEIEVPVEVTDEMMPGVVSVPHGWGHDAEGVRMRVGVRPRGRELEPPRRRDRRGRAERQRGPERNPGELEPVPALGFGVARGRASAQRLRSRSGPSVSAKATSSATVFSTSSRSTISTGECM